MPDSPAGVSGEVALSAETEGLRTWYLQAMGRRIAELEELRDGLVARDASVLDAARRVAQALRGSGGTFGFPELSAVSALVEAAPDADTLRRVEGLIEYLHGVRHSDAGPAPVHAEWLAQAAGVQAGDAFTDLAGAWRGVAAKSALGERALAERAAARLGLGLADLERQSRAALRLVPEALMRSAGVVPVAEDAGTVTVASADPTSLTTELELMRLTGRRPVFTVAPPETIAQALNAMLDAAISLAAPRRRTAAPAGVSAPERGAGYPREPRVGPGTVLVVDDDIGSRLLARTVLEKNGHSVVEASNGVEALVRLRREQPVALVVADLNMPELDGLELLWEMRDNPEWAHIPVIVLTGETDQLLETKLIEEGADDYVCKPLDPRLFVARVGATLRRAGE